MSCDRLQAKRQALSAACPAGRGFSHSACNGVQSEADAARLKAVLDPTEALDAASILTEIVHWKTRVFVPFDPDEHQASVFVIEKVLGILPTVDTAISQTA